MSEDTDKALPARSSSLFTWQRFPWFYLLFLAILNIVLYTYGTNLFGKLYPFVAIIITFAVWVLGIIPAWQLGLLGGRWDDVGDRLYQGRRLGGLLLVALGFLNCLGNLYYILILDQWRYYKRWEAIPDGASIWKLVVFNLLGMVACGSVIGWHVYKRWKANTEK